MAGADADGACTAGDVVLRLSAGTLASSAFCVLLIACASPGEPDSNAVATVEILGGDVGLEVAMSRPLSVVTRAASGEQVYYRPVAWESSDASVVSVTGTGVLTAHGLGEAIIRATSEGQVDSVVATVVEVLPRDLLVLDAHMTQATQNPAQTAPIVRGRTAVVNVLVSCEPACAAPVDVALRIFGPDGTTLVHSDTVTTQGNPGLIADFGAPSAQFLVPGAAISANPRWQVEVDPAKAVMGNSAANDLFPSANLKSSTSAPVRPLKLRFVPVRFTASGATASLTAEQLPAYLELVRSIFPLNEVSATIGEVVESSAVHHPGGTAEEFMGQALGDVDQARWLLEEDLETHWVGIVVPPLINGLQFGGVGFVPTTYAATGPGSRSVVIPQAGSHDIDSNSASVLAHELGHNFGRIHSPCGTVGNPNYPYPGGRIGVIGHDVASWANGITSGALSVVATRPDIMGNCVFPWVSDWTWQGVMLFRLTPPAIRADSPRSARERTLIVRGRVRDDRPVSLDDLRTVEARPSPETGGAYRLRGLAVDGRVLIERWFDPSTVSDALDQQFLLTVPVSTQIDREFRVVEIRGPAGATIIRRR